MNVNSSSCSSSSSLLGRLWRFFMLMAMAACCAAEAASVTNSLALMGLVSGPVPLKSQAVAVVPWVVVGAWAVLVTWG